MFIVTKDDSVKGMDRYTGFYVDLIAAIAKRLKFKYIIYDVKYYGQKEHGFWNGAIKEILEKVTYTCVDNY